MLTAIGGGLIAGGAVLLLTTLLYPPAETWQVGWVEHARRRRNANYATLSSGLATVAGAVILLVSSAWPWAFAGVAAAGLIFYASLAQATYREWMLLRRKVDRERSIDGRITIHTAAWVGVIEASRHEDELCRDMFLSDKPATDRALEIVTKRARLKWALRHPRGVEESWRVPSTIALRLPGRLRDRR